MQPFTHSVNGVLYQKEGALALLLAEQGATWFLRYAFVQRGNEAHLFPASILDDWGEEIRGAKMFRWLREQGDAFPRAEFFGVDRQGEAIQCFVRAVEIYMPYPCYICTEKGSPMGDSRQLHHLWVAGDGVEGIVATKRPLGVKRPLKRTKLQWAVVNEAQLLDLGWAPIVTF